MNAENYVTLPDGSTAAALPDCEITVEYYSAGRIEDWDVTLDTLTVTYTRAQAVAVFGADAVARIEADTRDLVRPGNYAACHQETAE